MFYSVLHAVFTQWPAARIRLAARVEWWFLIHIKAPCRVPQCHCDPIEAAATHTSSVQVTSVDTLKLSTFIADRYSRFEIVQFQ